METLRTKSEREPTHCPDSIARLGRTRAGARSETARVHPLRDSSLANLQVSINLGGAYVAQHCDVVASRIASQLVCDICPPREGEGTWGVFRVLLDRVVVDAVAAAIADVAAFAAVGVAVVTATVAAAVCAAVATAVAVAADACATVLSATVEGRSLMRAAAMVTGLMSVVDQRRDQASTSPCSRRQSRGKAVSVQVGRALTAELRPYDWRRLLGV